MFKHKITLDIIAVGVLLSILHSRAIQNSWYWSYWWMDVVAHFLGGLLVGLIALWVMDRFFHGKHLPRNIFVYTIATVLVVGIGWEIFEYVSGFFVIEEPFPDTFYDLIMDTLGGVASYLSLRSRK